MNLTEELIQLALAAPDARKAAAVRLLRGEQPTAQQAAVPAAPEPYLTLKECGKRLGFAACTLWMWDVPSHSLGGRPRFRLSEVETYLKSDAFKRRVAELKEKRRAKYRGATNLKSETKTKNNPATPLAMPGNGE